MNINLTRFKQAEVSKVNIDLTAARMTFEGRYDISVVAGVVERGQSKHSRDWFHERPIAHRLASVSLSRLPYEPKVK